MLESVVPFRVAGPASLLAGVEGPPHIVQQLLDSTVSARSGGSVVVLSSGCHANIDTPCLLPPCLNLPGVWICGLDFISLSEMCLNFEGSIE